MEKLPGNFFRAITNLVIEFIEIKFYEEHLRRVQTDIYGESWESKNAFCKINPKSFLTSNFYFLMFCANEMLHIVSCNATQKSYTAFIEQVF